MMNSRRERNRYLIIFMDEGVIVEEGRPEDVIDHPSNERIRSFLQKMEG